jgi:fructuronate reductase
LLRLLLETGLGAFKSVFFLRFLCLFAATKSSSFSRHSPTVGLKKTVTRLSLATLSLANERASRFAYDRTVLRPRIVHLGLGAFFRSHGALFTEDVLANEPSDWGITGVSLQRPDQRDRLAPQDCLYTSVEKGRYGPSARIAGCILNVLVAPEDPVAVVDRLSASNTAIVTLTITEKGYHHDPASGHLNTEHAEIRHDLDHPDTPVSAVGLITAALARRMAAGLPPFTVATCDNLPNNGALLAGLVREFAWLRDERLAAWIERAVPFPSSMIDRIVPAQTPADIALVEQLTSLHDAAPVMHEPFRQWVLEDRFVDGVRPPWERAGAQFVADVAPFEHAKLRMLNGSHSALAYLGYLAGHETIFDAVSDELFARFIRRFWSDDVIPILAAPPGMDLEEYSHQLLERYCNPAIRHRLWQIAMDGSQKLPQRLLSTVRDNLQRKRPFKFVALAVAGWIRYVAGTDETGRPIDVRDPLAATLQERIPAAGPDPAAQVGAVANVEAVFGQDLPADTTFMKTLTEAYQALLREGSRKAIADALSGPA